MKNEWGVTLGVKEIPEAEFVVSTKAVGGVLAYGYKIDKFGILAFGETAVKCQENWVLAYSRETGHTPFIPPRQFSLA